MATFNPRKSAPAANNKNFIHTSNGGYNRCIEINNGSCLPNCVGYAWGRLRELLGKDPTLSLGNAENWYLHSDGYKRGQTPKLGAVICWRQGQTYNGSDGYGHVAVVEEIKSNGDIVTSESCYGGDRFRTRTYTKASNYWLAPGFTFQGFIYPPVTFTLETAKKTTSTSNKTTSTTAKKTTSTSNKTTSTTAKKTTTTTKKTTTTKPKYTTGTYKVTADVLNVRTGAGTSYRIKKFTELTKNAQEQVVAKCGYKANGYVKGIECTVSQIKNTNWGKTPSGWICLDYCKKI